MFTQADLEVAIIGAFAFGVLYGFAVDWILARNRAKRERAGRT